MKASIAGGVIHSTDYFSSRDRDEGRAWLVMHGTGWHVLPRQITCPHGYAQALLAGLPAWLRQALLAGRPPPALARSLFHL